MRQLSTIALEISLLDKMTQNLDDTPYDTQTLTSFLSYRCGKLCAIFCQLVIYQFFCSHFVHYNDKNNSSIRIIIIFKNIMNLYICYKTLQNSHTILKYSILATKQSATVYSYFTKLFQLMLCYLFRFSYFFFSNYPWKIN